MLAWRMSLLSREPVKVPLERALARHRRRRAGCGEREEELDREADPDDAPGEGEDHLGVGRDGVAVENVEEYGLQGGGGQLC